MTSTRVLNQASASIALTLTVLAGCNAIVGLDKIEVSDLPADSAGRSGANGGAGGSTGGSPGSSGTPSDGGKVEPQAGEGGMAEPVPECTTNKDCTDALLAQGLGDGGASGEDGAAAVCVKKPSPHCVRLLSDDCDSIVGPYLDEQAIVIGSLFQTKGATNLTNVPRQQAAWLGVEQINASGGIPAGSTSANPRPLVMVSCNTTRNVIEAASHLVDELHVPAIVGPNTSQDTLDVSTKVSVPGGTVLMSPSGVASSIASLIDNDLTWLMVPSDVQRAPLMLSQINELETNLKAERSKSTIKLGIVFRDDALGRGTRTGLNGLTLNGKSMADPINLNNNVQIDPYVGTALDQQAIVTKYLGFLPDIIVLAGTAEVITKVLIPLEAQWPTSVPRPSYMLIDPSKGPELLMAVLNNPNGLKQRIRGTGITPGPAGAGTPAETFNAFQVDYNVRFKTLATVSGMGPARDAAYAIGLALAATRTQEVSGASVAQGLRKLAGGATKLELTGSNVLPAFQKLAAGEKITAVATFGLLDWDANGAVRGGTLEMWCIGGTDAVPVYGSSGLFYDLKTQTPSGAYTQCP